jgi:hypothetical protein
MRRRTAGSWSPSLTRIKPFVENGVARRSADADVPPVILFERRIRSVRVVPGESRLTPSRLCSCTPGYFDDETCPLRADRESLSARSCSPYLRNNCHPSIRNEPVVVGGAARMNRGWGFAGEPPALNYPGICDFCQHSTPAISTERHRTDPPFTGRGQTLSGFPEDPPYVRTMSPAACTRTDK